VVEAGDLTRLSGSMRIDDLICDAQELQPPNDRQVKPSFEQVTMEHGHHLTLNIHERITPGSRRCAGEVKSALAWREARPF